ncbi:MAG: hypothetical protein V1903_11215, partial [Bacteroidota bacterium]
MRRYIMKTVQNRSIGIRDVGPGSGKRALISRIKIVLCAVLMVLALGNQKVLGQGVGISEAAPLTPHASSILEIESTTKGFLAPRMTSIERNAIATPADGLLVYDTTTESFWYYDSASLGWKAFIGGTTAWGTANQVLGMNAAGTLNEYKTLQGTANRVSVSFAPGLITLSAPQDIHTGANPTFAGLILSSPLAVIYGGTGLTSGVSGGIPYFNSTTTMASSALLTANGVVIGGGAGTAPVTIGVGPANTVLRGTGGAPAFGQIVNSDITDGTIDLETKVTGILPLENGGTNADLSTQASNGGIIWSNATQMQILPGTATANQIILSGSNASPSWSPYTIPSSFTGAGEIMYTSAATAVARLAAGSAGNYLRSNGSAAPSWNRINLADDLEVMNILDVPNGGTGLSEVTLNNLIYGNGTSPVSLLSPSSTNGSLLTESATGAPVWRTLNTLPATSGILQEQNGGTGYDDTYSDGELLIGDDAGGLTRNTLTGWPNQIYVSNGDGTITLTLPQDIHTGAEPEFLGLTLSGLTGNSGVYTDTDSKLTSTAPLDGQLGYWDRDDALDLLTPANLGDDVATTDGGTITSSGLFTGNLGATISGAIIN